MIRYKLKILLLILRIRPLNQNLVKSYCPLFATASNANLLYTMFYSESVISLWQTSNEGHKKMFPQSCATQEKSNSYWLSLSILFLFKIWVHWNICENAGWHKYPSVSSHSPYLFESSRYLPYGQAGSSPLVHSSDNYKLSKFIAHHASARCNCLLIALINELLQTTSSVMNSVFTQAYNLCSFNSKWEKNKVTGNSVLEHLRRWPNRDD